MYATELAVFTREIVTKEAADMVTCDRLFLSIEVEVVSFRPLLEDRTGGVLSRTLLVCSHKLLRALTLTPELTQGLFLTTS